MINNMNEEEIAEKLLLLKDRADHDPHMQDYLGKAALPANLEYVRPEISGRRQGYFRRRPARDSLKQVEHRLNFSTIAYHKFGTKGTTVLNDGRVISKAARAIGNELRGTGSTRDPIIKEKERLIRVLKSQKTIKRVQAPWI